MVRHEIWQAVHALKAQGMSILIVDKSLKELGAIADRAVILERGRDVWTGAMSDLGEDEVARYLGV